MYLVLDKKHASELTELYRKVIKLPLKLEYLTIPLHHVEFKRDSKTLQIVKIILMFSKYFYLLCDLQGEAARGFKFK